MNPVSSRPVRHLRRLIVAMYGHPEDQEIEEVILRPLPNLLPVALTVMLLGFGILPAQLLRMVQAAIAG